MTLMCSARGPWKTQPDKCQRRPWASGSGGQRAAAGQKAHRKAPWPQVAVGQLRASEGERALLWCLRLQGPLTQINAPTGQRGPATTGYSPRDDEESRPGTVFLWKQSRHCCWALGGSVHRLFGKGSACSIPTGLDRHHGDKATTTSVSTDPETQRFTYAPN